MSDMDERIMKLKYKYIRSQPNRKTEADLRALKAENERLRETLKQFAEPLNWSIFESQICRTLKEYVWDGEDEPYDFAARALEANDDYVFATCPICSKPFTAQEWEERHDTPEGADCHAKCCPRCTQGGER